jgi:hypothetical protein
MTTERDRPWWEDEGGEPNDKARDFMLALGGALKAMQRVQTDHSAYSIVECCFWISAAAEAGQLKYQNLLGAIYWLRNKGLHATALAIGQVESGRAESPLGLKSRALGLSPLGAGRTPSTWRELPGSDEGGGALYNSELAGKRIDRTIEEACSLLLSEAERAGWQVMIPRRYPSD